MSKKIKKSWIFVRQAKKLSFSLFPLFIYNTHTQHHNHHRRFTQIPSSCHPNTLRHNHRRNRLISATIAATQTFKISLAPYEIQTHSRLFISPLFSLAGDSVSNDSSPENVRTIVKLLSSISRTVFRIERTLRVLKNVSLSPLVFLSSSSLWCFGEIESSSRFAIRFPILDLCYGLKWSS